MPGGETNAQIFYNAHMYNLDYLESNQNKCFESQDRNFLCSFLECSRTKSQIIGIHVVGRGRQGVFSTTFFVSRQGQFFGCCSISALWQTSGQTSFLPLDHLLHFLLLVQTSQLPLIRIAFQVYLALSSILKVSLSLQAFELTCPASELMLF